MKYRAICPGCGIRFPRSFVFRWLPHVRRRCAACGCAYRVDSVWEWTVDIVFGLLWAAAASLAILGLISWIVAAVVILLVFAAGYVLFPFITPFESLEDAAGSNPKHE